MNRPGLRGIAEVAMLAAGLVAGAVSPDLGRAASVTARDVAQAVTAETAHVQESYRYGHPTFARLLTDSYEETAAAELQDFPRWLETAYVASSVTLPGFDNLPLEQTLLDRARQVRLARDAAHRVQLEIETGAWLHRAIKAMIPRFSLDRGFEFANVVRFGERQCLLQSTLIGALLQAMDIHAGVDMVWKGARGEVSNNGHAVTVIKLSDGRDLLVDASEATPFVRHQGLFIREPGSRRYRFVEPVYDAGSAIVAYRPMVGRTLLPPSEARPLDLQFVRSQFYFYRGERAPGGLLGKPRTIAGLAASARFLQRAEKENPYNPLPVYVLGHVYLKQGKTLEAKAQYAKGYALYTEFGYVPQGPRAAYAMQ